MKVSYYNNEIHVTCDIGIAYYHEYSDDVSDKMRDYLIRKIKNGIIHFKINYKNETNKKTI